MKYYIKKCPFCKREAHLQIRCMGKQRYIMCGNCRAKSKICKGNIEAVKAWNRRDE